MLKKAIFYLLLFQVTSSFAYTKKDSILTKKVDAFNLELKSFMDSIKKRNNGELDYHVFVAYIYNSKPFNEDFCFTLGYILNEYEVETVAPDYVYYFNNEIILIRMDKKKDKAFLKVLNAKPILRQDSIKIANKLYPEKKGGFTYIDQGLTFCRNAENTTRTFYEYADDIPLEISIHGNFHPEDFIREIIYMPERDSLKDVFPRNDSLK